MLLLYAFGDRRNPRRNGCAAANEGDSHAGVNRLGDGGIAGRGRRSATRPWVKHARGRTKTATWFGSIGFRAPDLQWFASTATEIGVGVLLIVGLGTTFAAAGLIAVMTVAFWTVHRAAGFWVTSRPDEGSEYVLVLATVGLAIALGGPGEISRRRYRHCRHAR